MYLYNPDELRFFHNERISRLIDERVPTREKIMRKEREWRIKWLNRDEKA